MADNYQLITDSSSDLPAEYLAKEEIIAMPLSFTIDGKQYYSGEMDEKQFYARMRNGAMPVTSQVNVAQAISAFEDVLKKGRDILYIAFSSALSGTYNSARIATEELQPSYPDRKIVVVDSLSITLGQGLLVYLANQAKKAGDSLERASEWVRSHVQNVAHFITAADLNHLHRGGRISKASTIIGSCLGIQPIININDAGEAKVVAKKRGHKNALNGLVEQMGKVIGDTVNNICFISHADCEEDAFYVRDQVRKAFGICDFLITQAGPVLGAHTGPDAVALCMLAECR